MGTNQTACKIRIELENSVRDCCVGGEIIDTLGIIEASAKHHLRRHIAHVTVWSFASRMGGDLKFCCFLEKAEAYLNFSHRQRGSPIACKTSTYSSSLKYATFAGV